MFVFSVPVPVSVNISTTVDSPIRPIGSDVTLTCIVELSPSVNVPVTVNTVWTGPDGFMTNNTAQLSVERPTTYTSRATVSAFGRNQSGEYTCSSNVSSRLLSTSKTITSATRVTVGKAFCFIHQEH